MSFIEFEHDALLFWSKSNEKRQNVFEIWLSEKQFLIIFEIMGMFENNNWQKIRSTFRAPFFGQKWKVKKKKTIEKKGVWKSICDHWMITDVLAAGNFLTLRNS